MVAPQYRPELAVARIRSLYQAREECAAVDPGAMMNNDQNRKKNLRVPALSVAPTPLPLWVIVTVTVGSFLMIAGAYLALFQPQMLLSPHQQITQGVHVYAGYLVSRNLALGVLLLVLLSLRARAALSTLMVLYAFIQLLDVCNDGFEGRWSIVPGILILGVLFLIGAARIAGHPFWSAKAWRQAP